MARDLHLYTAMHLARPYRTFAAGLLFMGSSLSLTQAQAAPRVAYHITELYSPSDPEQAFAIQFSNTGIAISVLHRTLSELDQTRFAFNGGMTVEIEDFVATDLNDTGTVVGHTSRGGMAAIYTGGALRQIGTLAGGYSYATAVNSDGHAVGLSAPAEAAFRARAFLYLDGEMRDLGTLLGDDSSYAADINDSSEIVGSSSRGDFNRAFLYRDGQMSEIGGFAPEQSNFANAINNLGEIVGGFYFENGRYHAFFLTDGQVRDLGVLPGFQLSTALAINNHSQVIGLLNTRDDELADDYVFRQVPFIYSSGVMEDLNTLVDPESGWELQEAIDINDNGQIIGRGLFNGRRSSFVMTPVPEPSTLGLAAGAALVMLPVRIRRSTCPM